MTENVTCRHCGWVHFAFSREQCEAEVASFNTYFDSLSYERQKEMYGGISFVDDKPVYGEPTRISILRYERCFQCGGLYTNFRDSQEGDCPDGCTIQPIMHYREPPSKESCEDWLKNRKPRFGRR